MKIYRIFELLAYYAVPFGVTFCNSVGYIRSVEGSSMQPVLNPVSCKGNDFIFLNKMAVRDYKIERGDIVAFRYPKRPNEMFVKRVVALEGEIISTTRNRTVVVEIPEGHIWVEGDNKATSIDSNTFGPLALGLVEAKATYIVWPPARWGSLEK